MLSIFVPVTCFSFKSGLLLLLLLLLFFPVPKQTISGVLWGGTLFIHYGYFRRKEGDLFALCDFEVRVSIVSLDRALR